MGGGGVQCTQYSTRVRRQAVELSAERMVQGRCGFIQVKAAPSKNFGHEAGE